MPANTSDLGPRRLQLEQYRDGVLGRDRTILSRAITLVESSRSGDRRLAQALLEELLPRAGPSIRVGITGMPGAGKSQLIEALGCRLVADGHRVAVLTVDPSSPISGGSILADKTRMVGLSNHPSAFVRPSPGGQTLGGVARKTRESMYVCEAAGFDVILVETIGVGQAEAEVASMTDVLVVLLIPGAGDELQAMKRGLLELADLVAINKADGDCRARAELDATRVRQILRSLRGSGRPGAQPPEVVTCSALEEKGLDEIWRIISERHQTLEATGRLQARRRDQAVRWMWSLVEDGLLRSLHTDPRVKAIADNAEQGVRDGTITPAGASETILRALCSTEGDRCDNTGDRVPQGVARATE